MPEMTAFVQWAGEIFGLARDVWKEPERPTPLDNVIDVHMVRLRRKIDEGFESKLVHTVRGVGFTVKTGAP